MAKKVILWICTLFTAGMIFFFSAQQAPESAALSGSITEAILEKIPSYRELTSERQAAVVNIIQEAIRSLAHFSTFLVLGFFVIQLLLCYSVKYSYGIAIAICVIYAVTDELHQGFFSAGRACEFIDLVKDWSGSIVAIFGVALFQKSKSQRDR
ncbi:MAG: VanZ family protein [Oscillospiraceae bacterium]